MTKHALPWLAIHEYLLSVGKVSDARLFCVKIIEKIHNLIPYEQARIFILNDNNHVVDAVAFGTDKKWNRIYLNYYQEDSKTKYSFSKRQREGVLIGMHDWADNECDACDDFISNYIAPQGLRYSMGFGLVNDASIIQSVFSLDRIKLDRFSEHEQEIMRHLHPHLNNLHRMLLHAPPTEQGFLYAPEVDEKLTPREVEIADCLSRGTTPANISRQLCLSPQTVYRHIANIHKKLQVTNRQELIIKWMKIRSRSATS
jgi:DNA-binding CsgD family transcriptional regulator